MLHNLLDAAVPTPIDIIVWMFEENFILGLFSIISALTPIILAVVFIVLAAKRERDEDKKHEENYRKRMGK